MYLLYFSDLVNYQYLILGKPSSRQYLGKNMMEFQLLEHFITLCDRTQYNHEVSKSTWHFSFACHTFKDSGIFSS